jgi:hypothetical protein
VVGDVGELLYSLALHIQLVPDGERAGVGEHEVALPAFAFQHLENLDAVDGARGTGDPDDQALLHGA